jgi:hypothetical protein
MPAGQGDNFSLAGIALFSVPDQTQGTGGFEVPADLEIQLSNWMSVHKLPSGPGQPARKLAQTFGTYVDPITWDAEWVGPNADQKSRAIAAVHAARQPVTFQAGAYAFTVIVNKYKIKFHARFSIGYAIELEVLVDNSGLLSTQPGLISAEQQLTNQYTTIVQVPFPPVPPNM